MHQLDSKVIQLDAKLAEISMLIEEKKRVAYLPNLVQVEGSPEVCEGSTHYHNSMEVETNEQWEDKHNQIIQILEKMEMRLTDLSNPIKEVSSNKVTQSSITPTRDSIIDSLDDLCRVEKIVDDNSEDLKQLQVLTPVKYAHEVFDASPETNFVVSAVESSERAMDRNFVYHFTGYEMILNSKLHENKYGKVHEKIYSNCKNTINATHDISFETKVLIYKLHKEEHGQYHMKWRDKERDKGQYEGNKSPGTFQLAEPESYQAYKGIVQAYTGIVQRLMEIDQLPNKDKVAWKMILLGLVNRSGNIRGCELFNNKLCRNLVVWDGQCEIMCYKLHEDERGKVLTGVCFRVLVLKISNRVFAMLSTFVGTHFSGNVLDKRITPSGLSLSIDVSTLVILRPGPVANPMIAKHNVKDPFSLGRAKAKRMLKNLKVKYGILVANSLIDMNASCGKQRISIEKNDVASWNVMNSRYRLHGDAKFKFQFLSQSEQSNVRSNELMLPFGPLRSNLVGLMRNLDEVENLIKEIPLELNVAVWEAVLGDCGIHDFKVINSNQFLMSSTTRTRFASVIFATEMNDFCITRERIMLYCEEFVKRKHCNATGEASFKQVIEKMYLESQNVEMFEGKREVHLGGKEKLEAEIIVQRSFNKLCQVLRNMINLVEVFKCSLTYRTLEDLNTLPICNAITCTSMICEFANHLLLLYIRSKKKKRDDRTVVDWYCNFIFAAKAASYKRLPSILRFRLLNRNQAPRIKIIVSMFKKDQDTKDYGCRRHLKTEWNLLQVFQIYILVHMDVLKKWRPTKLFYIVHEHGESFHLLVISMLDLVMQLAEKEVENANLILTSSIKCMLVNCEDWNYKLKIIPCKLMMLILTREYTLSRKLEVCVARRLISTTSMTPHLEKKIESGLDHYVDLQAEKATSKPKLQAYQRVVKLGTRLSESDRKRNVLTGSYFLVSILEDKDVLKGKDMSQTKFGQML